MSTITVTPQTAARGATVTVQFTYDGDDPPTSVTIQISDGSDTVRDTVTVTLDPQTGTGTENWTVPADWPTAVAKFNAAGASEETIAISGSMPRTFGALGDG